MALIGEMQYLTIGGNTYSIPTSGGSTVTVTRSLTSGTKTATISVDGTSYDLYAPTPNAGTITSVKTTAGAHTAINVSSGAVSFNVPTKTSHLTNDSGFLTSYTETDPTVPSWAKASTKPTYTASEVGAATSAHTHGNITNAGDITATAPTIANGDQIIINDHSASKITNGPTFDGSTTTTALTPKGTWESFSKFSGSYNDLTNKPTIPTVPSNVSAFTNDAGYITSADVPEGASAYTGTISAVSTTASNGTSNGFARGDHVHNITDTVVKSALGTGSGTTKFLREDGTWATPAYTTNTDAKLQVAAVTSGTTYYPIVGTGTTAATRQYDTTGFIYKGTNGTTSAVGSAQLTLGNSTASGTANNKQGQLVIYGSTAYAHTISGAPTAARTLTLPNATGTIALTSDIPTSLPASDVYAWAKASTKPTYTASEVGALANDTTYVSTVTTTAGAHTAISSKSGAVSFNVPTKTSHLTNDSGFITASHTSTYSLPLAASGTRGGVQIGYSESGTNYAVKLSSEKMYVTVPWTDTKVTTTLATGDGSYYLAASSSSSGTTEGLYKHSNFYAYIHGSTVTNGDVELRMGNATASGTAGAKQGKIRLYTAGTGYIELETATVASSANRTIKFPNASGTVALTTDIPTVPTTATNSTTGISIAAHSSTTIYGVQSSTTTASKVTLGTAFSIPNISVSSVACDDITAWSAGSGSYSASVTNHVLSFSHTHTAPSLSYTARSVGSASTGTAFSVPNVTGASDVTVPIKNTSTTTVVTSTGHTITDNGHTHSLS